MQVSFMLWIQSWGNPTLDTIFKTITALGSDSIYIVFIAWLYWCVDRKVGEKWVYLILSSAMLNGIVKLSFNAPRPFQVGKGIVAVDTSTATGHSFPSGHSQASATFGGFLAMEYRSKIIKVVGIGMLLAIGLSRLYLRVHWPIDILVGWTLGLCFATFYHYGYDKNPNFFKGLGVLLFFITALFFRDPDQIKLMGLFIAVSFGMWYNDKYLQLPIHTLKQGGLLKLAFGIISIALTMAGLKLILPVSLNMLRYGLVGITLSLVYPWVFTHIYANFNKEVL
jgi:membrane-associated phospholipid phosphatase